MGDVARLGVVVGLPREAAILKRALADKAPPIFCSGMQSARVGGGAEMLIGGGAESLLSFGFAGGLDPTLIAGDIILPERVLTPDGTIFHADAMLRARLMRALDSGHLPFRGGAVAGVDAILTTPADKRRLYESIHALAVDMESHLLAAAAAGRPFAVLRVVVDPADHAIPAAVTAAIGPKGTIRTSRLAAGLIRKPAALRELWALAQDGRRATSALRRAAVVLGTFGCT